MKIRIGVGAGGTGMTGEALAELVTALDDLGFDSLWLSEVLTGPVLDPVAGLACTRPHARSRHSGSQSTKSSKGSNSSFSTRSRRYRPGGGSSS